MIAAFISNTNLTSVYISKNISNLDPLAFDGCTNLTSIVVDEGNQTYTSMNSNCVITSNNSAILILGCKSTTIPAGVKKIGTCAFYNNNNVQSITIPSSCTTIQENAFYGCTNLTSVTFADNNSSWLLASTSGTIELSVPDSAVNAKNLKETYVEYTWSRSK